MRGAAASSTTEARTGLPGDEAEVRPPGAAKAPTPVVRHGEVLSRPQLARGLFLIAALLLRGGAALIYLNNNFIMKFHVLDDRGSWG